MCQTPGPDPETWRNFPGFLVCRTHVILPRVARGPAVILYQHPARAHVRPGPRGPRAVSVGTCARTVAPGWVLCLGTRPLCLAEMGRDTRAEGAGCVPALGLIPVFLHPLRFGDPVSGIYLGV